MRSITQPRPLSLLDLAIIGKGQTAADALAASVAIAQAAERALAMDSAREVKAFLRDQMRRLLSESVA